MAMAAPSLSSFGGQNVMLMRGDLGTSGSLVAMLNGFQVARSGGGLEDIACGQKRPSPYNTYPQATFEGAMEEAELEDAMDGEAHGPVEKKRRLSFDQVRSLEKNFELENKLEPERKMQLAKELGLQPRQVAVWFQNRRARWKTKQLERDYEVLNTGYLKLKADFEAALREKDALKAKVQRLSGKTASPDSHSDVESSQCDSEAAAPEDSPKDSSKAVVKQQTSSDGSNADSSSELLDADSPRTTESNRGGLGDEDFGNNLVAYCDHFPAPESFVAPGELAFPVKLEDGQSFDTSCNCLMVDLQGVLPWWDWA